MSGLLIGILLSRTFSGILGSYIGWRNVYLLACFLIFIIIIAFIIKLPENKIVITLKYKDLLLSFPNIIKKNSILREVSVNGVIVFSVFCAMWGSLIFLLEDPVYNMSSKEAGLLSLIDILGAIIAPFIAKTNDKRNPRTLVGISLIITFIFYIILFFFGENIFRLIFGIILIDLGV